MPLITMWISTKKGISTEGCGYSQGYKRVMKCVFNIVFNSFVDNFSYL